MFVVNNWIMDKKKNLKKFSVVYKFVVYNLYFKGVFFLLKVSRRILR